MNELNKDFSNYLENTPIRNNCMNRHTKVSPVRNYFFYELYYERLVLLEQSIQCQVVVVVVVVIVVVVVVVFNFYL